MNRTLKLFATLLTLAACLFWADASMASDDYPARPVPVSSRSRPAARPTADAHGQRTVE